jgi:hypothetical protein
MVHQELEQLEIQVTRAQKQQIEQLARERGYESAGKYLLALVTQDAKESDEIDEDVDPVELFREGWKDVIEGNTYPASTLWEDIDEE